LLASYARVRPAPERRLRRRLARMVLTNMLALYAKLRRAVKSVYDLRKGGLIKLLIIRLRFRAHAFRIVGRAP